MDAAHCGPLDGNGTYWAGRFWQWGFVGVW